MLKTRVITAVVLVAVFLIALYFLTARGWLFVCAAILAVAAWEWAGLTRLSAAQRAGYSAAMVVTALLFAWNWIPTPTFHDVAPFYLLATAFWIFGMPLWLKRGLPVKKFMIVLIVGWVVLPACFFAMVHLRGISPNTLLRFMAIVWLADSAAYFAGRSFGRHKLAPSISPGKTWEGVAGALLAVTAYGIGWCFFFNESTPPVLNDSVLGAAAILPVLWILAAFSICGDLFESALKRLAGVKDSGKILPGHGGILDRIDALIPVLPMSAILFLL